MAARLETEVVLRALFQARTMENALFASIVFFFFTFSLHYTGKNRVFRGNKTSLKFPFDIVNTQCNVICSTVLLVAHSQPNLGAMAQTNWWLGVAVWGKLVYVFLLPIIIRHNAGVDADAYERVPHKLSLFCPTVFISLTKLSSSHKLQYHPFATSTLLSPDNFLSFYRRLLIFLV